MSVEAFFELAFAAGVIVAAAALAGATLERLSRPAVLLLATILALASVGGWVVFALDPGRRLALSAGGLAACALAALGALGVRRGLLRGRRIEQELERAEEGLRALVEREAGQRAAELERTLARTRSESLSLLAEEERRIAEERRRSVAEQERQAGVALSEALAAAERRVEQRFASWADDMERAQSAMSSQLARIERRQQQLIAEAQARIESDRQMLEGQVKEQVLVVSRLREEIERTARQAAATAHADLEAHESERRRALDEMAERLRRRERDIAEWVQREEAEAFARIQQGFADFERRQLEQIERVVERAAARYSQAAAGQFEQAVRAARDDAGRRLARELNRSVETHASEARTALAERTAHLASAGSERMQKRLEDIAGALEGQREEAFAALERRVLDAEVLLRDRLERIAADHEAERAVLDTRLRELARRTEAVLAQAEKRLATLETLRAGG